MVDKSEKFSWFVRLGYLARGMVYLLLGYIALSTAGKAEDGQAAVFDLLQDIPLGTVILYFVAVGLLAYAGYKAIDAASDLENHGSDTKGRMKRVGSAASAVAHLLLAWTAYQFATGEKQQSAQGDGGSQETASSLLAWEIGPFVLGVVGIGFLIGAAMQAKNAWTAGFMKRIGRGAPDYVCPIGRAGHAARAVVFLLIGWSVIRSAWFSQSSEVKGLGDAIVALSGSGIYSLVAVGLIMFGVFSMITARYRVIPDVHHGDLKPHF